MEEVPRRTSLVPFAFPCFVLRLIGVETEGLLDYQGRAGDHFHCTVEPSPGHIRCRKTTVMKATPLKLNPPFQWSWLEWPCRSPESLDFNRTRIRWAVWPSSRRIKSRTKNQPKEEVFGTDIPQTSRGHSRGYPGTKLLSGRPKSWKNKHLGGGHPRPEGADVHDPKGFPKTSVRKTLGWIFCA